MVAEIYSDRHIPVSLNSHGASDYVYDKGNSCPHHLVRSSLVANLFGLKSVIVEVSKSSYSRVTT